MGTVCVFASVRSIWSSSRPRRFRSGRFGAKRVRSEYQVSPSSYPPAIRVSRLADGGSSGINSWTAESRVPRAILVSRICLRRRDGLAITIRHLQRGRVSAASIVPITSVNLCVTPRGISRSRYQRARDFVELYLIRDPLDETVDAPRGIARQPAILRGLA